MDVAASLSECQSTTTIWTYYPCSFIISSSSSLYCQQASISLSIDQCTDREITFFWHFPLGNMTITLESDKSRSFVLHLSKASLSKRKLIKNIYHLTNHQTREEQLLNDDDENEIITVSSDQYNQCSIKFETSTRIIFDYGTFIRLTVMTNNNNNNIY